MKALSYAVLAALLFALAYAPAHAAIPAPTPTPAPPGSAGVLASGGDMAIPLLFASGIFLAGVVAVVLVRRGGSKTTG